MCTAERSLERRRVDTVGDAMPSAMMRTGGAPDPSHLGSVDPTNNAAALDVRPPCFSAPIKDAEGWFQGRRRPQEDR